VRTYTSETDLPAAPERVIEMLCDPDAIARWAPVDFEILDLEDGRLCAGGRARVQGELAGRTVRMDVDVHRAGADGLALTARGPIELDVEYALSRVPRGSRMRASVSVGGSGVSGRLLASVTEVLLRAGALNIAIGRLGTELDPALP
jgi:hypothetical protein